MNDLLNLLVQRQLAGGVPPPPAPTPQVTQPPPQPAPTNPVIPPNIPAKLPSQEKRFQNAQLIQQAYAGDWTPNPVLLRAQLGHK